MKKVRIYEYAKEVGKQSKDLITVLKDANIEVSNHMSMLTEEGLAKLDSVFKKQEKAVQNDQSSNSEGKKNKKKKIKKDKNRKTQKQQPAIIEAPSEETISEDTILVKDGMTVGELSEVLSVGSTELIKKLFMELKIMANINQSLTLEQIELIAMDYGKEIQEEVEINKEDLDLYFEVEDAEKDLKERAPIVTIMGHVDHGKTTLLDTIRNSRVTAGEAGGITQHIGAYQVRAKDKKITFLDTPGHAAFTTMRARGAKITDVTILVVAADDGVMPQTIEAINHAKAAEVPIIVAVNKMDKPQANPDRVMNELVEYGLISEEWGGDTIFVPISALKGEGIDELLENILLVTEMQELKANPNRLALGTVIEAKLDKGRGAVATLLVQNGSLNVGDPLVVGNTFGRVRAMINDRSKNIQTAKPSTPVEITGLQDVPNAGDRFVVFGDEKTARQIGEKRQQQYIETTRQANSAVSLDTLFEQMKQGEMKDLNIIIKADVQGSVEALAMSLAKIDVEGVNVRIIHTGVGAINESDITLAVASNAVVIGFNVRPDNNAKQMAQTEQVDIRLHSIIYKVIEEIEAAMTGLLDPEFVEKVIGLAEVRQVYKVSKIGTIAGAYVTEGKVSRDGKVRVIRDSVVIYEGEIDTLRRFKDDVKEVQSGYECGMTVENFNDIKEGDVFEVYIMEEVKK
ncbi:translation initiation factor IF-2 [Gemella haemolysans]|uniref:Translation initiation factor IF-2 n=1 Tax=Gemella haemolysans ATCC 10379 TaxID=546270 RepID=C5NYH5_9BACL|nr:translation initiation factor IF-2 [Gemella haemolysans]EER68158.1 translation initiation factor IF-2 [Gemella haemolysans ATCC 10379]KAA8709321.1 translation initiation factor IF-2 [Gemella haemolysans]UBH83022.1 translation initiation factor IF-2 [Gemella haemolysans]